jgi:hypothetical protein
MPTHLENHRENKGTSMQVQSSGAGPVSGYSPVQSAGRRPEESGGTQNGQQSGAAQASGGSGGNQPVQDPGATRGRNVNITA